MVLLNPLDIFRFDSRFTNATYKFIVAIHPEADKKIKSRIF
jgi:hypothetical protein